eukprot:30817-Pelagococcus_subviridis.AAC.6
MKCGDRSIPTTRVASGNARTSSRVLSPDEHPTSTIVRILFARTSGPPIAFIPNACASWYPRRSISSPFASSVFPSSENVTACTATAATSTSCAGAQPRLPSGYAWKDVL